MLDRFTRSRTDVVILQTLLIVLAYYGSFLLRFDLDPPYDKQTLAFITLPAILVIKVLVFQYFGLFSGWWRYAGISDLLDIIKAASTSFVIEVALIHFAWGPKGFPRSIYLIDMGLTILIVGGARLVVRTLSERTRHTRERKNTLIIGAGRAGITLVRELNHDATLGYRPVGFVDDERSKVGVKIEGLRVLGTTARLDALIAENRVECVLIAIPSAEGRQVQHIVHKCRECKVDLKILPAIRDQINGSASIKQVRRVRPDDLLGRKPVQLNTDEIRGKLQDKVLLVTGGAGSIGSEMVRQVAGYLPQRVVILDRSENELFRLCTELSTTHPELDAVPVVGDILDVALLRDVMAFYRPDTVFHAAAYKHVPMMESNCFQAVVNNVFGTYNVALVAQQCLVRRLVMISSDKAVRPTNIMGATKRVAELIILGLQQRQTNYMAVRFGNVLGSNGSVLPIFEEQIARGGPVTVTHPDAKRYFMTIPEAAQLVLQAMSMGLGGQIFMLEMGEPIRILDLARNLIRLSGLEPERDIPIVFTGLRPGEKLSEELMLDREGILPTAHEQIRTLLAGSVSLREVQAMLEELSAVVEARNVSALVDTLKRLVPEYTPSEQLLSLCRIDQHDFAAHYRRARAELKVLPNAA